IVSLLCRVWNVTGNRFTLSSRRSLSLKGLSNSSSTTRRREGGWSTALSRWIDKPATVRLRKKRPAGPSSHHGLPDPPGQRFLGPSCPAARNRTRTWTWHFGTLRRGPMRLRILARQIVAICREVLAGRKPTLLLRFAGRL